jgi:protein disulfide-isomerase A6
VSYGLEKI